MDAQVGDQYIVNSRVLGKEPRVGEIVECIGRGGLNPHFRVRWADGRESIVYPSSDARDRAIRGRRRPRAPQRGGRPATHRGRRPVRGRRRDGQHPRGADRDRASLAVIPRTREVPLIGEELAIARALGEPGVQLEAAAYGSIQAHEDRPVHLV